MGTPDWKLELLLERIKLEAKGDSVNTDIEDFDPDKKFLDLEQAFWVGYNTGSVDFAKELLQFLENNKEK